MIIFLVILFIIVLLITTQTMWWHPKPHKDILHKPFSSHMDFWNKNSDNKNLLICLHGMYSHPTIYQELSDIVVDEGWDVYAPVLPNASQSPEELSKQIDYQWLDSFKVALHRSLIHNQNYEKIVLLGHSQGGALALSIAPSLPFLSGLIVVAAPDNIIHKKNSLKKNIGIALSGLLYFLVPKRGLFMKNRNTPEKSLVEGTQHPREFYFGLTLHSMRLGLKQTRKNLKNISTRTLLIYEKGDRVVDFSSFENIFQSILPAKDKLILETPLELEPYSNRHRLLSYIYTKDQVFDKVSDFLRDSI